MGDTSTLAPSATPTPGAGAFTSPRPWFAFALLGAAILIFFASRESAQLAIDRFPKSAEILFYLASLASLGLAYLSKTPTERSFRLLSLGVGVILALAAAPVLLGYPVVNAEFGGLAQRLFTIGPLVVIACAVLAYWRPVTLIACGFFPLAERASVKWVSGLPIGTLDIYPVYEVALFLGTSAAVLTIARMLIPQATDECRFLSLAWIFALGIHFGNYFHSGIAKLAIDGPWLAWVFENQTNDTALLAAWYNGRWLFSHNPELTVQIAEYLGAMNTPINWFVLLIQIAAPIAILRLGWIKIQSILYDIMHIGIFLIVGILFWKWIFLNLAFLGSAMRFPRDRFDKGMMAVGALAVIFGITVAQTAQLAWYNTPALSSRLVFANTDEGKRYRVPISYFLNQSYSVSHARFTVTDTQQFPTSPMGNARSHAIFKAALACDFSDLAERRNYRVSRAQSRDQAATEDFIRAHHAFFVNLSDDGRFNYVMFPFHHFSNPADYEDFFALDKRRITSYTLVARSHCLSVQDGQLSSAVKHETRYDIPVR